MRDPEAEQCFPALVGAPYNRTSPKDTTYNCVAWAVGDTANFWDDIRIKGYRIKGYYWPSGVSADTLEGWIEVFEIHGYKECDSYDFHADFEKVAIYGDADGPTHVARQTGSGKWTSKLGKGCDMEHSTLDLLEGDLYGEVKVIMQRPCKDGKRVRS